MPPTRPITDNTLFYGDNLEVLRKYIRDETIDLCYIDPPFNSKRNYNQIYNNIGTEDRAQAQAFVDTWTWDSYAVDGFQQISRNDGGRFTRQTIELINGLHRVLGEGSLLAYLVSIALRAVEIRRVLRATGTFYLHCDPTASHYLKVLLDAIFGGTFRNEIVWCYAGGGIPTKDFPRKHDTILRYTKTDDYFYQPIFRAYSAGTVQRGRTAVKGKYFEQGLRPEGTPTNDWWTDVPKITSPTDPEKLGYPTQKPEALLDRIITASSREGDTVLDAYCGCGTTIAVAERLNRKWIGIDITYQSIALVLRRLGEDIAQNIILDGIPSDMASAYELAHKRDDRLRKEFEKWAVLTYTNNRAAINEKRGADEGIDGTAFFQATQMETASMIFQVKSGNVDRGDVATLRGDMERVGAAMATLITLQEPTRPMVKTAKTAGPYHHELMGRNYDKIQIVTVQQIIEENKRLNLPMSFEVVKTVRPTVPEEQAEMTRPFQQPDQDTD